MVIVEINGSLGKTYLEYHERNPEKVSSLLIEVLAKGEEWSLDYSEADEEEIEVWQFSELATRVMVALIEGRKIICSDQIWQIQSDDDNAIRDLFDKVMKAIAPDDICPFILADDEDELKIDIAHPELDS